MRRHVKFEPVVADLNIRMEVSILHHVRFFFHVQHKGWDLGNFIIDLG